jgi:hypothetical protein
MAELNPEDRYQLRKLQMDIDKKELEVRKAQQDLERLVLELENKYGLIGEEKTIDARTATVKGGLPVRNGKSSNEALLKTHAEDAAA